MNCTRHFAACGLLPHLAYDIRHVPDGCTQTVCCNMSMIGIHAHMLQEKNIVSQQSHKAGD